MTAPVDIDELERLLEKATGPVWTVVPYGDGDSLVIHSSAHERVCFMVTPGQLGRIEDIEASAYLITNLRNAAPSLIAEVKRLREALDTCMIGGNHLANVLIGTLGPDFAERYSPGVSDGTGLLQRDTFDVWSAWSNIMQARDALNPSPPEVGQE